jgi:hypothetical protein
MFEARRVLADCEAALEMLEDERDEQRWRVLWVGALALVRAVGHVLGNVDGRIPEARDAIKAAYGSWKSKQRPEHLVFREFIDRERNNILKEYRMNVLDSSEVAVVAGDSEAGYTTDTLDENLYRPTEEGFGVGEDARDVYREAIGWWDEQLARLEAVVKQSDQ